MTITSEHGHEVNGAAEAVEDRVIIVCGDEVWSGEVKWFGKDRYYIEVQTDAAGKPHRYCGGLAALRETWRRLDTGEVLEASADERAAPPPPRDRYRNNNGARGPVVPSRY